MWKRRLIAVVTFLAGLYYFLEFVVPPTIPWQSVSGRVLEVTPTEIRLQSGAEVRSVGLEEKILIFRQRVSGTPERVAQRVRALATDLRIGQLIACLHMGNLPEDVAAMNTHLVGTRVLPQVRDLWADEPDHWTPEISRQRVAARSAATGAAQ